MRSLFSYVQGIVKLRGGTDNTIIGNTSDSLKVLVTSSLPSNTTATVTNLAITLANTEQSFSLPANCKSFILQSRKVAKLSLGYSSGVSSLYFSLPSGSVYTDNNFYASQDIYISSSVASNVVEIITFI